MAGLARGRTMGPHSEVAVHGRPFSGFYFSLMLTCFSRMDRSESMDSKDPAVTLWIYLNDYCKYLYILFIRKLIRITSSILKSLFGPFLLAYLLNLITNLKFYAIAFLKHKTHNNIEIDNMCV